MGLKPEYRITANGADITGKIQNRLMSLVWTDEAGLSADTLEITLSDSDPAGPIQKPPKGATLALSMGYDGQLQDIGTFTVDELEFGGWPAEVVIRARAAPFDATKTGKSGIQSQKTRSWPKGSKLGAIVRKIAQEHGLTPAISKQLEGVTLPHIDQADESDIHFLLRLAKKYDAAVKPTAGRLVFTKRGEGKTVSGLDIPPVVLSPTEISRFRVVESARETAGMVVAYWHATKSAKRHEVSVGTGEPVYRLKMYYPTSEMALAAARAEMDRRTRRTRTVSFDCPGRFDIGAEGLVTLGPAFRDGVAGDWIVRRVTHTYDPSANSGGHKMSVEGEEPNAGGTLKTADTPEPDVA